MEQNENVSLEWSDRDRRRWSTRIDVPLAFALKKQGFDFANHETFSQKIADPYDAADFAFAVHRSQCDAAGIDEATFLDLMTDIEGRFRMVLDACIDGAADFLARRGDLKRATIVRKAWTAAKLAEEAASKKLSSSKIDDAAAAAIQREANKIDAEIDRMIFGENWESSSESTANRSTGSDSEIYSTASKGLAAQPGTIPRQ